MTDAPAGLRHNIGGRCGLSSNPLGMEVTVLDRVRARG
jgi:hypothetical protein